MALWLSSQMAVVSVMGALKTCPIGWRRWSSSLVASTAEASQVDWATQVGCLDL
jgi:hypothetical protein